MHAIRTECLIYKSIFEIQFVQVNDWIEQYMKWLSGKKKRFFKGKVFESLNAVVLILKKKLTKNLYFTFPMCKCICFNSNNFLFKITQKGSFDSLRKR